MHKVKSLRKQRLKDYCDNIMFKKKVVNIKHKIQTSIRKNIFKNLAMIDLKMKAFGLKKCESKKVRRH